MLTNAKIRAEIMTTKNVSSAVIFTVSIHLSLPFLYELKDRVSLCETDIIPYLPESQNTRHDSTGRDQCHYNDKDVVEIFKAPRIKGYSDGSQDHYG